VETEEAEDMEEVDIAFSRSSRVAVGGRSRLLLRAYSSKV